jgi:hypothetical protein
LEEEIYLNDFAVRNTNKKPYKIQHASLFHSCGIIKFKSDTTTRSNMMENNQDNQNPREIPTHKDPEKVNPIKDPSLKPSTENPTDPKKNDPEIKS